MVKGAFVVVKIVVEAVVFRAVVVTTVVEAVVFKAVVVVKRVVVEAVVLLAPASGLKVHRSKLSSMREEESNTHSLVP